MKTKNPIRLALEDVLIPAGYTRKGDSWFRRTDEIVEVVNLQKSNWGQFYYLNYGLWLQALGKEPFPREERCHIRMRTDSFVESDEPFVRLLNMDSDFTDDERRANIKSWITSEFLPVANDCRMLSGLRARLKSGKLKQLMILKGARPILEEPPP